jgi:hypothetical protein
MIKKPDRLEAKLVDSGVQLVSQKSPFGQVKGAFIALEAQVLTTTDLGLTFKFNCYDNSVGLDFEDIKPELDNCRLVYLGSTKFHGIFLVVEKSMGGEFRRVGYAELAYWKNGWNNLLSSTKREVIVIE